MTSCGGGVTKFYNYKKMFPGFNCNIMANN